MFLGRRERDLGAVLPGDCLRSPILVIVVDISPVGLAFSVVGLESGGHVDPIAL
jgi:hypothetical protein